MTETVKIGTRGSELALWQANYVAQTLEGIKTEIVIIKTKGDTIQNVSFDKIEGKGFFTKEIEEALLEGNIDIAVHSLKDMPTEDVPGLTIVSIPKRSFHEDLLIISPVVYDDSMPLKIKRSASVGTSSMRRLAQIKNIESSYKIEPLRGNVNTRMEKLSKGLYDAIVMARAAVARINLDLGNFKTHVLGEEIFLPAPAQGALGIQIREGDSKTEEIAMRLHHGETAELVSAERAFLSAFGGGCHVPIGAFATRENDHIVLEGMVASPKGEGLLRERVQGSDPITLGKELSEILKNKGADKYL